jgi:CheY-like chemotaxis protein
MGQLSSAEDNLVNQKDAADEQCPAGMNGYLTKPIDRAQLQACMQMFLSADDVAMAVATSTI